MALASVRPPLDFVRHLSARPIGFMLHRHSLILFTLFMFASCSRNASAPTQLTQNAFVTRDQLEFGVRRWNDGSDPKTVVIGVHGIAGVSKDFENLAEALEKSGPEIALVAFNTRGQGMDPREEKRGDIGHRERWLEDLDDFTNELRKEHPTAKIVWAGESMGALIVLHSYARSQNCDAIILSSPIATINDDVSFFKRLALSALAKIFPRFKLSLQTLSGKQDVKVTSATTHEKQVAKNPWHVQHFTLRLLENLAEMIEEMDRAGQSLNVPTLVLSAGRDVFIESKDTEAFARNLPAEARVTYRNYPESYPLLFYDEGREQVIADTLDWLQKLP